MVVKSGPELFAYKGTHIFSADVENHPFVIRQAIPGSKQKTIDHRG